MKFQILLADPPWPERITVGTPRYGADRHFDTMTEEEISCLPIKEVAYNDNCLLFLWTTARHMMMAGRVMECWGFKYVTVAFTWIKIGKSGEPIYSLGWYTQPNAEFCLLGRRGRGTIRPEDQSVKSVILQRRGKLAEKPEEVRSRIEQMYSDNYNRLELFARKPAPGWTCIGKEISGRHINEDLQLLKSLNGDINFT